MFLLVLLFFFPLDIFGGGGKAFLGRIFAHQKKKKCTKDECHSIESDIIKMSIFVVPNFGPLIKIPALTHHRQDTSGRKKSQNLRVRLKPTSRPQRLRRIPFKGWKEWLHSDQIAYFSSWHSATLKEPPRELWFLPWEKESPRWTSSSPTIVGYFRRRLSVLASWGSLQGLTTGDQIEMEKGKGAYSNQCSNLGEPYSCLQWCPSRDPSQWLLPSTEPRWWPHLAR